MHVLLFPVGSSEPPATHKESNPKEADRVPDPNRSPLEALPRINGRTTLYWVAQSLAGSQSVQSVRVICEPKFHEEIHRELPTDARFQLDAGWPQQQTDDAESTKQTFQHLEVQARKYITSPTLLLTCSNPHWESHVYDEVIRYANNSRLDSALFYLPYKQRIKPDAGTFISLDGATVVTRFKQPLQIFSSIALIGPEFVNGAARQVEKFAPELEKLDESERKSKTPSKKSSGGSEMSLVFRMALKSARIMGYGLIWRFFKRQLTPEFLEKTVNRVFETRFECVEFRAGAVLPTTAAATKQNDKTEDEPWSQHPTPWSS